MKHTATKKQKGIYKEWHFFAFISPWLVGFIAFTLIPMLYSLYASFTQWDGISNPQWTGIQNFIKMFAQDERFLGSIWNTLYYNCICSFKYYCCINSCGFVKQKITWYKRFSSYFLCTFCYCRCCSLYGMDLFIWNRYGHD